MLGRSYGRLSCPGINGVRSSDEVSVTRRIGTSASVVLNKVDPKDPAKAVVGVRILCPDDAVFVSSGRNTEAVLLDRPAGSLIPTFSTAIVVRLEISVFIIHSPQNVSFEQHFSRFFRLQRTQHKKIARCVEVITSLPL